MSAFEKEVELASASGADAVSRLHALITREDGNGDAEIVKHKETAITKLTDLMVAAKDSHGLKKLLTELRAYFSVIPKAKTAKIVRSVIDSIAKIPGSTSLQLEVCKEQMEWAKSEKRTFLRQRIELRLASLHLETRNYAESLSIIGTLRISLRVSDGFSRHNTTYFYSCNSYSYHIRFHLLPQLFAYVSTFERAQHLETHHGRFHLLTQ